MALRDNIIEEPVSSLALRKLVLFSPHRPVREACDAMEREGLGAAIAVDATGRPVGMFNEKILIRILTRYPSAMDDPAEGHMTRNVVTVRQGDSIAKLIGTMQTRMLRWVCVVNDQGKAVALTGLRGVMEYVVEHHPRSVKGTPIRRKLSMTEREGA